MNNQVPLTNLAYLRERNLDKLRELQSPLLSHQRTFSIGEKYYESPYEWERELECIGTGKLDDPFIIESHKNVPKTIYMYGNRYYVLFKDFNPKYLEYINSENVTLENSRFKSCNLYYCSNIRMKHISSKVLKLEHCKNSIIEDSTFNKIKIDSFSKENIIIKNCNIHKIQEF